MKRNKANFAGLTSPGQQSEMKSILDGTWPPLKPLPVFKYETGEYRATIDFDKKRGEWVCRKTALPSNEVQELRGGLSEITLALPHGEPEILIEGAEQQEPEFERETSRRLQAIREWRERYENGARCFELRDFLTERQRTELDDSLRLTLTARQLQFNPKNAANVFDDLSVAGGRFAALIEHAKRKKANPGAGLQVQTEAAVPEVEPTIDHDEPSLEISSPESGGVLDNTDPFVPHQEAAERFTESGDFPALSIKNVFPEQDQASLPERIEHTASQRFEIEASEIRDEDPPSDADDFPALSIKNVFPEQDQTPLAERVANTAFQPFEIEASEILDEGSASLVEHLHQEEAHSAAEPDIHHSRAFACFAAQGHAGQSFADRIEGSSSRFPALKISAFQVNVFAILFLFAVTSFTVGLTVGRGPLGKRLREAPKSLLATEAKPPILPDEADESTSQTPSPPVGSSDDSAGANGPGDATSSEEKSRASKPAAGVPGSESAAGSDSVEARSTDEDSSPTIEPKPSPKPELNSGHSDAAAPVVGNVLPPARSKLVRRPKPVGRISRVPRSRVPYSLASTIVAAPQLTRASTILVTVPGRGSQPFRVSFPEKTIAATSSLAMTSQLSILVFPEPDPGAAYQSARLEAGALVSFGWPHYPTPGLRHGLAETIRVRATIGQLGQVEEVKFLGGSASLLPATTEAIRQWRYRPTLLDKRPVQAQQDITIEFRPPKYTSQMLTRHPPHN